jgi:ATP/ADP translocase
MVSLWLAVIVDVQAAGPRSAEPVHGSSGPTLLRNDAYLRLIALLVLAKNCVNALGEYILDRRLLEHAHRLSAVAAQAYIGAFKSRYLTLTSVLALALQVALVPWFMRRFGVGRALLILPAFVLAGYAATFAMPVLTVVLAVKIGENGGDYSIQKTAEQALYLLPPRVAKYKVKAIVDTVLVRAGDVIASLVVATLVVLSVSFRGAVAVALALAAATLGVSFLIAREHRVRVAASEPLPEPLPEPTDMLAPPQ